MIKTKDLREKSTKKLNQMLKDLQFEQIKASCVWGREKTAARKSGVSTKGTAKKGSKTSLSRDIKKVIAKIKTIIKEREND